MVFILCKFYALIGNYSTLYIAISYQSCLFAYFPFYLLLYYIIFILFGNWHWFYYWYWICL